MLCELHIRNLAVVDDVNLSFEKGLNVLTGSTGAGKSLILSAVNFLLGERSNTQAIRAGEEKAAVEGVFAPERPVQDGLLLGGTPGNGFACAARFTGADGARRSSTENRARCGSFRMSRGG